MLKNILWSSIDQFSIYANIEFISQKWSCNSKVDEFPQNMVIYASRQYRPRWFYIMTMAKSEVMGDLGVCSAITSSQQASTRLTVNTVYVHIHLSVYIHPTTYTAH